MKRVILAAAFIVAIGGCAAAQSISAKSTSTKEQKAPVKKQDAKTSSKNTVLKQETSANAKADSSFKVVLPLQKPSDTTAMPALKKSEEF